MDRCHHSPDDFNPADCLMFTVEERWQCGSSGKVRYVTRDDIQCRREISVIDVIFFRNSALCTDLLAYRDTLGTRVQVSL